LGRSLLKKPIRGEKPGGCPEIDSAMKGEEKAPFVRETGEGAADPRVFSHEGKKIHLQLKRL